MYSRILVPVDGSDTALAGLRVALRFAGQQDARMRIVHVVDELVVLSPSAYGGAYERFADQMREAGMSILSRARTMAHEAGMVVETQLIEALGGVAGERVLNDAKGWHADLIVCGTHGRRGLRRIVLGSDAEFMVRHTPVPILLVRYDGQTS